MTIQIDKSTLFPARLAPEDLAQIIEGMTEADRLKIALHALRASGQAVPTGPLPILSDHIIVPRRFRDNYYALLVGIGKFQDDHFGKNGYPEDVPLRDVAEMMSALMNHCGYLRKNIQVLLNEEATEHKIMNALIQIKKQSERHKIDQVVVFLSSHGHSVVSGNLFDGLSRDFVFVAFDTDHEQMLHRGFTGLKAVNIAQQINDIDATEKVVFIDTCEAGHFSNEPGKLADAEQYVLSCNIREKSYVLMDERMSVFSKCLVTALTGDADTDRDGQISLEDVIQYLWKTVNKMSLEAHQKEQHPTRSGRATRPVILVC